MNVPTTATEVTKDEFYAAMGPRDVHPSVREPDVTIWELRNRDVVGYSLPGWKNPGDPSRFFLVGDN